jgi:DNA-binding response OmpR family regulator
MGYSMSSPNDHLPPSAGSSDDLKGLTILLVEDSREVGEAVRKHLELLGARVAGPAATTAEAEGLLNEHPPDVALVDFHLREGERSDGLIARLRKRGVPVIMLSGSFEFPPLPSVEGATFLEKPISEAQLLAHLGPLAEKKATR